MPTEAWAEQVVSPEDREGRTLQEEAKHPGQTAVRKSPFRSRFGVEGSVRCPRQADAGGLTANGPGIAWHKVWIDEEVLRWASGYARGGDGNQSMQWQKGGGRSWHSPGLVE